MAWANRTATTATQASGTTDFTSAVVNKPAGVAAGDALVVAIVYSVSSATVGTVTPPTGFTARDMIGALAFFTRIADGTEGATFTVSWTNAVARTAIICHAAFDVRPARYDAAVTFVDPGTGTAHGAGPLTVARPNSLLVYMGSFNGITASTWAASGGLTEQAEALANNAGTVSSAVLMTEVQAAAGSSGAKNADTSGAELGRQILAAFYVQERQNLPLLGVG